MIETTDKIWRYEYIRKYVALNKISPKTTSMLRTKQSLINLNYEYETWNVPTIIDEDDINSLISRSHECRPL